MSIGVPIKVLHEAEGHIITCETITGEVYRGKLIEAEDNMNCQMTQVAVTYRDGHMANLENVYIRGSKIRFLILPDMLKNAPMFKKQTGKGLGGTSGRGKAAILRAQGELVFFSVNSIKTDQKFVSKSSGSRQGRPTRRRSWRSARCSRRWTWCLARWSNWRTRSWRFISVKIFSASKKLTFVGTF